MSRAFVKEDDGGQAPIVPPRAALPPNTPNYVTPAGLEALHQELEALENQRRQAEIQRDNDAERTRQLTILKSQISALTERISSAKLVEPAQEPTTEIRFGAKVSLKTLQGARPGTVRTFQLVGVDEADVKKNKIAFIAPIAQAVLGHQKGDEISLNFGPRGELVQVTTVSYE